MELRCQVCQTELTFTRWPAPVIPCPECKVKKFIVCHPCLDSNPENIVDRCGCRTGKPVICQRRGYAVVEVQG